MHGRGFRGACRARDQPRAENCPPIISRTIRATCENFVLLTLATLYLSRVSRTENTTETEAKILRARFPFLETLYFTLYTITS